MISSCTACKAAARAEEERAEREAAEAELRHAVEVASASRELEPKTSSQINSAVLTRPIKRARRAVEAPKQETRRARIYLF